MIVYQTGPVVLVYLKLHTFIWETVVLVMTEKPQGFTTYRNTQFDTNKRRQGVTKKQTNKKTANREGKNKILQS